MQAELFIKIILRYISTRDYVATVSYVGPEYWQLWRPLQYIMICYDTISVLGIRDPTL